MLDTPQRLMVSGADPQNLVVLAGRSSDGKKVQILVANYRNQAGCKLIVEELPWGGAPSRVKEFRLNEKDRYDKPIESTGQGGRLEITSTLASPTVELVVLETSP